ncbi:MAG: 2-phospho-L-lactate transferase [Chloroflexi bacterium UTCFX4]|jgi:LPPG:FO 2-phospho-L-lactate transferase (EC 2.7.1.-)|nr:MAG: 2-phospho-L-lactate transferase [Chloroflexi bacterium UTCFX4]
MNLVALAGGVGGAKLADGLQRVVGENLTVVVNTGDDFQLHDLYIAPDLDTVMYTLAGIANRANGWGIEGDTYNNLDMLSQYGGEDWFRLGDRDLATHLLRTQMLRGGYTLTQTTQHLARALNVRANILPMCNEAVATIVNTNAGELAFQEYFVHRRWQPVLKSYRFHGIEKARVTPEIQNAVQNADAIIFCPSNPFVSIEPILSVKGMRELIQKARVPKIAVSPIVGGEALKGPAAKMFQELGMEASAFQVAKLLRGVVDRFVLDRIDEAQARSIKDLGMRVWVTDTVMRDEVGRERLAREIVEWVNR